MALSLASRGGKLHLALLCGLAIIALRFVFSAAHQLAEAVPLGHEVYMTGSKHFEHHVPHSHSTGTVEGHGHEGAEAHQEQEHRVVSWRKPLLATAVISIFPTLILPLIPLSTSQDGKVTVNQDVHKTLLSFAAGGLLGEVFLHAIPHLMVEAFTTHKHDHHSHHQHDHGDHGHHEGEMGEQNAVWVSVWLLAGFLIFFVAEKVVKLVLGKGSHPHHNGIATPTTAADKNQRCHNEQAEKKGRASPPVACSSEEEGEQKEPSSIRLRTRVTRSTKQQKHFSNPKLAGTAPSAHGHGSPALHPTQESEVMEHSHGGMSASGYLNVVVDCMHNFTDGIAIGAAFTTTAKAVSGTATSGMGIATTVAVFLHEIPHEIGDYAILVQSGLSLRSAFLMQFVTAGAAFIGCFVGLLAHRHEMVEKVLQSITAGGFLYISTVSVLPELLSDEQTNGWQTIREVTGIIGGIGIMALVTLLEGSEHHH